MLKRLLVVFLVLCSLPASAQYNMKKLMEEGRRSLDVGYYVVSMQIFQRVVSLKPNMYEAWYLSGLSKYHLEDYEGAIADCSQAIRLNPYIPDIFDLRAMSRIKEADYDSAAVDFTRAIEMDKDNRDYWFNRAYCFFQAGDNATAVQQLKYITSRWKNFAPAVRLLADIREGKKPAKIIPADKQEELKLRTLSMGKWLNQSYGSDETVPKSTKAPSFHLPVK